VINKRKLIKAIAISWGCTLMGLFNIAVILGFATLIVVRLRGPAAVMSIMIPTFVLIVAISCLAEVIVNLIYGARAPDPKNELDTRFQEALKRVARKAWMLVTPRGWVLHGLGVKNAMTYGLPFPGLAAVGITRELIAVLTDDELEAVLAHECGHIKCRDTAIVLFVSLILGALDKLYGVLSSGKALWTRSPITLVAGWAIYFMGKVAFAVSRFSISQEREFSADALAVWYLGDAKPVASLLRKLQNEHRVSSVLSGLEDKPLFEDIMISHPGLAERITEVESFILENERSA
jgi:Zn-dependent protease with chaperone function